MKYITKITNGGELLGVLVESENPGVGEVLYFIPYKEGKKNRYGYPVAVAGKSFGEGRAPEIADTNIGVIMNMAEAMFYNFFGLGATDEVLKAAFKALGDDWFIYNGVGYDGIGYKDESLWVDVKLPEWGKREIFNWLEAKEGEVK